MSLWVAVAVAAAGPLVVAGALKVLEPDDAVGALHAQGFTVTVPTVRLGAAAELLLGIVAIVSGGWLPWMLVAFSYLAFARFVAVALRRSTPISSCGCFGREDTPPSWRHVAIDAALFALAVAVTVGLDRSPLDVLVDDPVPGVVFALAGLALTWAVYQGFRPPAPAPR